MAILRGVKMCSKLDGTKYETVREELEAFSLNEKFNN